MSLLQDFERVLDVVKRADPSFATVDPQKIDHCVEDVRRHAADGAKEAFLLSAMQLLALPRNGHTRLIPNDAISVLPLRFVTIGTSVFLTKTTDAGHTGSRLIAVNGTPVEDIEGAAQSYLAGNRQRQRVIGPLLLAWPAALARLGVASDGDQTEYQFLGADGQRASVNVKHTNMVLASEIYPRNEHGQIDPLWDFKAFVDIQECSAGGIVIRFPSFFDPDGTALPGAIERAAAYVRARPDSSLVIDVRGNTGGDFLKTMPFIDALTKNGKERRCAVVVDKFTFSAAIVFVALLKYRLGNKLTLVGEDMGDGLRFFAEGGLMALPASGAVIRYSSALHDWETGSTDKTTPAEIARQLVPVGKLAMDRPWAATPFDTTPYTTVMSQFAGEPT